MAGSRVLAALLIVVLSALAADVQAAWYDSNWQYRKLITIDAADVDANLTDFPVYVNPTDLGGDFLSNVKADGGDIRVTKADGTTELAREVIVDGGAPAQLHFKADSLSSSVNTSFFVYYGNASATEPAASSTYGSENVWTNSYKGVWHLEESPSGAAGEILDDTTNANHGTTEGSMNGADLVSAKLGKGLDFDGLNGASGDLIRIPDSASLDTTNDEATIQLWIQWTDASDGGQQTFMSTSDRFQPPLDGIEWSNSSTGQNFYYPWGDPTYQNFNRISNPFTNGVLHHLVVTHKFSTKVAKIYVDGVAATLTDENVPANWTTLAGLADWLWGGNPDPATATSFFTGLMDEIRVADIARTAQWISTEYKNQSNAGVGGFLAGVGSEETESCNTTPTVYSTAVSTTYNVPAGCDALTVKAWGAGGGGGGDGAGSGTGGAGGGGGFSQADIAVTPGESLTISIGGGGASTPSGGGADPGGIGGGGTVPTAGAGVGGGGADSESGDGGGAGGYSAVLRSSTYLVQAGGGGGGGGSAKSFTGGAGGAGGGTSAVAGAAGGGPGGAGGGAGTASAGGAAGSVGGAAGSANTGGAGGHRGGGDAHGGGGGGGGGKYGGGGGGYDSGSEQAGGGGGGGSGLITGTNTTLTAGSGTTPGNNADPDYAASAGIGGGAAANGNPGRIVIIPSGPASPSATGFNDPAADTARAGTPPGNPANAYGSDDTYSDLRDITQHDYFTYNFCIPDGATIQGVEVRTEWHTTKLTDTGFLTLQLRDNAGLLVGTSKTTPTIDGTTDVTHTLGGAADTWGASLTDTIVRDGNFGVSLLYTKTAGGGGNKAYVDNVDIKVSYSGGSGGCMAHWQFDEGTGQTAADSSANGNDATLGSTGGTDTNDPAWSCVTGGYGLDFDGVDNYANVGGSSSANSLTNDMTVAAWIKADDVTGLRRFAGHARTNSADGWAFGINGNALRFTTYSVKDYDSVTATVSAGTWYHVAAVMDTSNDVTFYVDGAVKDTITHTTPGTASSDDDFYIGSATSSGSTTLSALFDGQIEDLRIYDRTLTGGEISALATTAPTACPTSAVGHWTMDEGTGQTAADSSGNANDGQLGSTTGVDADDPAWSCVTGGNALSFDSVDDRLDIPFDPSLNLPDAGGSVAGWFKLNSSNIGQNKEWPIFWKKYISNPANNHGIFLQGQGDCSLGE